MSSTPVLQDDLLKKIVAEGSTTGRARRRWRSVVAGILVISAAAGYQAARRGNPTLETQYRTEPVTLGALTVTVSATGNLQPTNEVDVGSEVSGLVETVLVDDNDRVKNGQVLARLDVSKLQDQVVNARAALASADARVLQAAASVKEARANLSRLRQVADLSGGKVPSKAEMETAEAAFARAEADEVSTKALVDQSRAAVNSAETNLAKASIRSPIDGIVLSRQIEPGQTVAASFQSPTLFTLAEDLAEMQLEVDVDEADVGQVRDGQVARFTVDAYPKRQYPARILRVGYGSQTKDGVVSYTAVLSVDNDDLSLRPGMTATADITTVERTGVLLVPNEALRFTPPVAASPVAKSGGIISSLIPRPPDAPAKSSNGTNGKTGSAQIWLLRDGRLTAAPVTVGHTDGRFTEVRGPDVKAGVAVVVELVGG